jgi:hypothetical protein
MMLLIRLSINILDTWVQYRWLIFKYDLGTRAATGREQKDEDLFVSQHSSKSYVAGSFG